MDKKILVSVMVIGLVAALAGAGLYAYFSDTETSGENTFQAGTLDLKVGGQDDPNVAHVTIDNIKPGWSMATYSWRVKNTGNLPGLLWFEVTPIINKDNGVTEPELGAPGEDGTEAGELGANIVVSKLNVYDGGAGYTRLRIGSPSGPEFSHGKYNLNYLGGLKLYALTGSDLGILDPGEDEELCLVLSLPSTVGNCVQGDSVEFDIIFHLEQITP
jgi:predicted ribosomally synthesized peptide with SipW-like signal peptide